MTRSVSLAFVNAFSQLGNVSGAYVCTFPLSTYSRSHSNN